MHRRTYDCNDLSTKRSTKHLGPSTVIHLSISIGQLVLEKDTSVSVLAVYYIQSVIRIQKNHANRKNSTFKSKHATTKWNENNPGHCMHLYHVITCITLHPPKLHGCSSNIFETRAIFVCLVHGVHVAAKKMSYGSLFVFLGCFQDVTASDPIQRCDAADRLQTSDA